MKNWKTTSIAGKLNSIKESYKPGISARGLADSLSREYGQKISRNTVLGIYARNPEMKRTNPLISRGTEDVSIIKAIREKASRQSRTQQPRPMTRSDRIKVKRELAGDPFGPTSHLILPAEAKAYDQAREPFLKGLMDIGAGHCHFVIKTSPSLFCAEVTAYGSTYCQHHHQRCTRPLE